jgi:hypothetical protein
VANKLGPKNNARGQFQIAMTTLEGTINCVVSVPVEPQAEQTTVRVKAGKATCPPKLEERRRKACPPPPSFIAAGTAHSALKTRVNALSLHLCPPYGSLRSVRATSYRWRDAPSPAALRASTSPRWGEVKSALAALDVDVRRLHCEHGVHALVLRDAMLRMAPQDEGFATAPRLFPPS